VVLSALGCGFDGHPPEEVALIFKREIYRVGSKMPYIYFAIQDENQEPNPLGNFEIFTRILTNEADDPNWLSGYDVWMNHLVATLRDDFPQEMLGDAGGPGANLHPRPEEEDINMLQDQTGNLPMEVGTGGPVSFAAADSAERTTVSQPYHSADAASGSAGRFGAFRIPPAHPSSVLPRAAPSDLLENLIIFERRPTAALVQRLERPDRLSIWQMQPSLCIDPAPDQFLQCYVVKIHETAKYRDIWDHMTVAQLTDRASKGHVRDGPGEHPKWIYGVDTSPRYCPSNKGGNQRVDMQVAELLDYSVNVLDLQLGYWRNDSRQGSEARTRDNTVDTTGKGDVRRYIVPKIVRALYGKPKCSFASPLELYVKDDTYYFPDGAAFCKSDKPTAFMSAYALSVNPACRMIDDSRLKGRNYLVQGRALTNAPSASSASSSRTMPAPKAPAVKKRPAGAR
jgi:hypothetical protein